MNRRSPRLAWLLLALGASAAVASGAPQEKQDAKNALQAIEKELQQEWKELRQAARELEDDEAAAALYHEFRASVLPEFGERYAAIARAEKGTELAETAWLQVVNLVPQGLSGALPGEAVRALTSDHLQSPRMAQLAGSLRYGAASMDEAVVLDALRALAAGSSHRAVQAQALYSLGAVLVENRPAEDPKVAEGRAALGKLAQYADVEQRGGRTFADAAAAFLFALDNLVVGKPCPDFEAIDAEGARFKLSDYKGKVVLIDFWGFW